MLNESHRGQDSVIHSYSYNMRHTGAADRLVTQRDATVALGKSVDRIANT
jgi:hypothetical protein